MTSVRTTADRLSLHRRFSWSETTALALAAVALALGAAAWIADSANTAMLPTAALPANADLPSFADRFQPASTPESPADTFASRTLDQSREYTDDKTYSLGVSGTTTATGDHYKRHVYSTLIVMPNRSGPREPILS